MSKQYTLHIRVGVDYYPINWQTGHVCWDETRKPSYFSEDQRPEIMEEIGGRFELDYKFIEVTKQPLIPNEVGTKLTLVKD